jgi:hypothetical protein
VGAYIDFIVATGSAAKENCWRSPLERNYNRFISFRCKHMASKSILLPPEIGTQVPGTVDINPIVRVRNLDIRIIRDLCQRHYSDQVSHIRNQYFPCSPCDGRGLSGILCGTGVGEGTGYGFAGRVDVLSCVARERTDV